MMFKKKNCFQIQSRLDFYLGATVVWLLTDKKLYK